MSFTVKGVKLMGFDHELADRVGLYSVLSVEVQSSGSAAASHGGQEVGQGIGHISDGEVAGDAAPSTPELGLIASGADRTQPMVRGEVPKGAHPRTHLSGVLLK